MSFSFDFRLISTRFRFSDIDDKHARRDRYTTGPTSEFKEKEGYKPDVNIEYVDDTGRRMNEKEAFRYLSHRFHGKGSGKKKTEKRAKKILEEEVRQRNLFKFWLRFFFLVLDDEENDECRHAITNM